MKLQEEIEHFRRRLKTGRPAQAYTVVGALRGDGTLFAETALGMLLCAEADGPCGSCRACRQVTERTHPDVLWVEPQKKSRLISIEQVRDLQKRIYHTSFAGGWKGCAIVGADRLGDAAANAFLKTLEEPPGRSVFFLLTDSPQFLLPTIRSRCQQVLLTGDEAVLPDPWRERVLQFLAGSPVGDGGPVCAFARAEGLLRLLRDIRSEVENEQKSESEEETVAGAAETVDARVVSRYREVRSGVMRALLGWYRDILLLVCGLDDTLLLNVECADALRACAHGRKRRRALRDVEVVRDMNRKLERNIPEDTVLGWGFSRLDRA